MNKVNFLIITIVSDTAETVEDRLVAREIESESIEEKDSLGY
jgi:hypothetical protein